jgi:fucose permease
VSAGPHGHSPAPVSGRAAPSGSAARAACWLGYGVIGLAGGILGPVLPALRSDLHAGYGALAILFVVGSIGGGLGTLFGNRLLDRVGYRRLVVASGLALGLVCLARPVLPSLLVWAVLSAIASFSANGIDIGGIRYIAAAASEHRNAALSLLNVFYSAGSVAAPLVVSALAATGASVLWAYILCGVLVLAMAGVAQLSVPAERPTTAEADVLGAWRWALGRPVLVRLALAIALYAGLETGFSGWAASYAQERSHLSVAVAALFPLAFWGAMTIGRALASERARHWSERALLTLGSVTTVVGGALALAARGPLGIAAGIAITGLGCGPIWPSAFALAAHLWPDRHSEAYGLLYPAASVGVLAVPWLSGQLFAAAGARAALGVPIACAVLMGGLIAYVLVRDSHATAAAVAEGM